MTRTLARRAFWNGLDRCAEKVAAREGRWAVQETSELRHSDDGRNLTFGRDKAGKKRLWEMAGW